MIPYSTELDPAATVSERVKRWRPEPDSHHVGNDQNKTSGDSGLSRKTNLKCDNLKMTERFWFFIQTRMILQFSALLIDKDVKGRVFETPVANEDVWILESLLPRFPVIATLKNANHRYLCSRGPTS